MSSKTPDKDLAWEVIKWWTNGDSDAYWADHLRYLPGAHGRGRPWAMARTAAPQLADCVRPLPEVQRRPRAVRRNGATIEDQAEAQIQDCYGGKLSAEEAVSQYREDRARRKRRFDRREGRPGVREAAGVRPPPRLTAPGERPRVTHAGRVSRIAGERRWTGVPVVPRRPRLPERAEHRRLRRSGGSAAS